MCKSPCAPLARLARAARAVCRLISSGARQLFASTRLVARALGRRRLESVGWRSFNYTRLATRALVTDGAK